MASNASMISSTIPAFSALRRSGSSRVTMAIPSAISVRTEVMSGGVAHHRGRVAEELLDVALVAPLGGGGADGVAQADGLDERPHRAGRRVLVAEARLLEPTVVDAAAVAQQVEQLGGQRRADPAERPGGET